MTHGITATDSQIFLGKPAWPPLGETNPTTDAARFNWELACSKSGLDWRLLMAPLKVDGFGKRNQDNNDDHRYDGCEAFDQQEVPDKFAMIREDTGDIFNVCTSGYYPYQNKEMFRWFQPLLDTKEVQITTAGSLHGGRTVWAMCDIINGNEEILPGDDITQKLMVVGSHTKAFRTKVVRCVQRVVCQNTLTFASDSASQIMGVSHTKNQMDAMACIRESLDTITKDFKADTDNIKKLAGYGVTFDGQVKFVKEVLGVKESLKRKESARVEAVIEAIRNSPGADMAKGTLWGALNAITNYTTHYSGKDAENRFASVSLGANSRLNQKAYELALTIAG